MFIAYLDRDRVISLNFEHNDRSLTRVVFKLTESGHYQAKLTIRLTSLASSASSSLLEPVIVPLRLWSDVLEPVIVPVAEPVIVPDFEPVIVPAFADREPVIVPAIATELRTTVRAITADILCRRFM